MADTARQVDGLLERLDAMPDHEKLHQALAEVCKEAAQAYTGLTPPPRAAVRGRAGEAIAQDPEAAEGE